MARTRLVPVVAALVLVAAALAGVAPVGAAQESASVGDYTVTRGDTVSISVGHSAAANLTIGSDEQGFEVVVPLGGSGSDTVELDTYATTGAPSEFLDRGGATMTTPPLREAIEPGRYTLTVTIDGDREAVGNLVVEPRGETTGTAGVLPGDVDFEETDTSGVFGRITERSDVARGDHAAFVVNENGLSGAFGEDVTASSLDSEGLAMRVTELDPEPNTDAETYSGSDGDFRVLSQVADGDRFLVLWDTGDVELGSGSNHTYEFELRLDGDGSPLVESDEALVTERVRLAEPSIRLTADPAFTLAPWDGSAMRVNGRTNLAPTTALNVRALQESPNARLWQDDVTVSANGTFETSFDFASASRPGAFPLWVNGHRDETRHTVRLTGANASLLFPAQTVDNGSVTVERVSLSEGGFLRLTANNTTVGATGYLGSRTNASVDVPLNGSLDGPTNVTATALVDDNGNGALDAGDPAYVSSGEPVADTALVEPATTAAANNTTTAPTTERATPAKTTIRVDDAEPLAPVANNDGSSGGFAPLSPVTTLVALVAAALLALRRGPDSL